MKAVLGGIAVLAAYLVNKEANESLPDFLNNKVFAHAEGSTLEPTSQGAEGFNAFMKNYVNCLPVEELQLIA